MKKLYILLLMLIFSILMSSFVSADFFGWLKNTNIGQTNIQGLISYQLVPTKIQETPCRVSIGGNCIFQKYSTQLDPQAQKFAKSLIFKPKEEKKISGKRIKINPTTRKKAKKIKIDGITSTKKVTTVQICIEKRCKDYSFDELVQINGAQYQLGSVQEKIVLFPRGMPILPHKEDDQSIKENLPIKLSVNKIKKTAALPQQFKAPEIRDFWIGFIIDRTNYPTITEEDILAVLDVANAKLELRSIPIRFKLHDIIDLDFSLGSLEPFEGESGVFYIDTLSPAAIDDYYFNNMQNPPNGIILFWENPLTESYGGYSTMSSNLNIFGFTNNFYSPSYGDDFIYGGTLDFDHIYAACGYDTEENIISDVSLERENGDKECGGMGVPCIWYNGASRCSSFDLENLEYVQPNGFIANNIIHEFLHLFDDDMTTNAHYCTEDCPELTCDLTNTMSYSAICPDEWDYFRKSWNRCLIFPLFTEGNICNKDCQCSVYEECIPQEGLFKRCVDE